MKRLIYLLLVTISISRTGYTQEKNTEAELSAKKNIVNLDTAEVNQLSGTTWTEIIRFARAPESVKAKIWGGTVQFNGVYPKENLSSFFSRRIHFNKINFNGSSMKWIFTGKNGGITIALSNDSIILLQRYYNSFGLHGEYIPDSKRFSRFPESTWKKSAIYYNGILEDVIISMNHNLELSLYINGSRIVRQECQIDVDRHQLVFSGITGTFNGSVYSKSDALANVEADATEVNQKIVGFGAITSVKSYNELSDKGKDLWWKYIRDYNLLIQREYPIGQLLKPDLSNWDNLNDAVIHYYGENYPNGEISDFNYNKKIQEMGGFVVFEFWQLPDWMYEVTKDINGKEQRVLNCNKYANAIVNYCQTAKAKTGNPPEIVGIQNEVTQTPETWAKMTITLRKALDDNGFKDVKMHMHNSGRLTGGISAAKAFTGNPEVWKSIDFAASNLYDYQGFFTSPDGFDSKIKEWNGLIDDKPFLSTELCINDSKYQSLSYRTAFLMGELYHKNMALMNACGIMYCWGLLNGPHPTFDGTRSLFRIDQYHNFVPEPSSFQLRVFGSFSRHILKGMNRIETYSDNRDLLATAYVGSGKKTMVLINRSDNVLNVTIRWGGTEFQNAEITDQFNENSVVNLNSLKEDNKLRIEPGQIITLF